MKKQNALSLLDFIHNSLSAFHVILEAKETLNRNGFTQLFAGDEWHIENGGKYYVTKNHSSLFAFVPGSGVIADYGFKMVCDKCFSLLFRRKPIATMLV